MSWFALITPPQTEFKAERILSQRFGYEVFCPKEIVWRRQSTHSKRKVPVSYPLLPRYIFTRFEEDLPILTLMQSQVVSGYVACDMQPAIIPDGDIDRLRFISGAPIVHASARKSLRPGDQAEITVGPFAGQITRVRSIRRHQATVLMKLLNSIQYVTVPLDALEAA
jgi:transcription antitermination factor NusG